MNLTAAAALVTERVAGMPTRMRRRVDLVLLVTGALLVGGAAAVGAALGDAERITGLWAGAAIGGDGRAGVVEVVDYDFGTQQRHGMFRDVPGLTSDAHPVVWSATAPSAVALEDRGRAVRIRIGDPSRTISGRHRYKLSYPLDDVAPGRALAWDAVGTDWPVGISNVEVHVVAPFAFEGARCVQGEAGSQRRCEVAQPVPGHLLARIRTLPAGQGATLYASPGRRLEAAPRLPVPSSGLPADATSGRLLAALVAGVAALAAAGLTSWLVRRAGRERVVGGGLVDATGAGAAAEVRVDAGKLRSLATVEFAPPAELTPAQGGVLLADTVRESHKVAWLVGAATDGYLDLQGGGQAVTLVRRRRDASSVSRTLDAAFAGRQRLPLGAYDSSFAAAWRQIGAELAAWRRTSGLWDPAGDLHRRLAWMLGAVVAAGGVAVAGVGGALASRWSWAWLALAAWGALVAGAGIAAVARGWELRVRTPLGSALWLRVEAFRRFLAGPEAHYLDQGAKQGVLGQYTAWAVALGEVDQWCPIVAASAWGADDPVGRRYSDLAPALPSAARSSTVPPTSSGSGDGGDWSGGDGDSGGTGGGGGGGGGGSW
jgi:hypothetical protein